MERVFIVEALRTAIGSFGGTLANTSPVELGAVCAKAILNRFAGLTIDEVILGNVLGAGHGMNVARQVALHSGLPHSTPAFTVNKVCGSGLKAVALGYQSIAMGGAEVVLAGGSESMSQSGHITMGARWGTKMGALEMRDLMLVDGLTDAFNACHMGITAENIAARYGITREQQDRYALESQKRAAAAQSAGRFVPEIVETPLLKKGKPVGSFLIDEYVRSDATLEGLAKLSPAFKKDGSVTAGNSSGINDGAALLLIVSERVLRAHSLTPKAEIVGVASAGVDPAIMGIGPVPAVRSLLQRSKLGINDIGVVEANEAFAVQALAVCKDLEIDPQRVNRNGGAIALGHPIGASGARILVTLVHELERANETYGIATLCVGGGQGIAMLVRRS